MLALVVTPAHCYDSRASGLTSFGVFAFPVILVVIMHCWSKLFALLTLAALVAAPGCGRVVFTPRGAAQQGQPIALSPQQQQTLALQQQQLQQRADALDRDNQELESLLAQSRQQMQLMRDQVVVTQDQLKATADRLASTEANNQQLQTRAQAFTASVQQPAGAEIRPNNTLLRPLAIANLPGVNVKQDGDTIRVSIAGDQLFTPGTPQFLSGGDQIVQRVTSDLMTNYPEHLIGIEGHTDSASPLSSQYPSPHHLTVAQATAVYDQLRRTLNVPPSQLFVIGHGANHPLVSNATAAGQAQNRRIELVVYPETTRTR